MRRRTYFAPISELTVARCRLYGDSSEPCLDYLAVNSLVEAAGTAPASDTPQLRGDYDNPLQTWRVSSRHVFSFLISEIVALDTQYLSVKIDAASVEALILSTISQFNFAAPKLIGDLPLLFISSIFSWCVPKRRCAGLQQLGLSQLCKTDK